MPTDVDLQPLSRALRSLEMGLAEYARRPEDDIVRDGCIQRFEFTYAMSHKTLKRFLEATAPEPAEIDAMSFQELIRTGSERGLLQGDWLRWKAYRDARSATSHAYDERKAKEVFAAIPNFVEETRYLLERLKAELAT